MNSCVSEGLLCYCSQLFYVSSFGLLSYLVYYYLGKVLWEKNGYLHCIIKCCTWAQYLFIHHLHYESNTNCPCWLFHFKQATYWHKAPSETESKMAMPCLAVAEVTWSSVVAWPLTCGWHLDTTHIHTEAHWLLLWQVLCQVLHVFFLSVYHEIAGAPSGPWVCRNVD